MNEPALLNALIAGATGASGRLLTQRLLDDPRYGRVHIVHYRPTGFAEHPKATEHLLGLDDLEQLVIDESIGRVFCCLGTTLKQAGSVEAFARVDRDYVVALGRWAKKQTVAQLHVVSSLGVSARSPNYYSRTKGQMEQGLGELELPALVIYRPSMLHALRNPPRRNETLSYPLVKALCTLPGLRRFRPLNVADLAAVMHHHSLVDLHGVVEVRSATMQGAASKPFSP
ncbi:NAD-dependent epimerase/dehydratase family protein [Aestuariirhabdus sp. LZHN29]|uniref:NAD-dependent epimerase/dehydratase family protein n=1 Tax=Aestuariirhabdus sp. LZHN29 TaxID=3417462 RepID=UPI003CF9D78C